MTRWTNVKARERWTDRPTDRKSDGKRTKKNFSPVVRMKLNPIKKATLSALIKKGKERNRQREKFLYDGIVVNKIGYYITEVPSSKLG